jgi:hypothetical protein
MTACAYRSLEPVLRQRFTELQERRALDATSVDAAQRVARRRVGRAVAGGVGVAMALAAFASALHGFKSSFPSEGGTATELLLLAWPVALVAGGLARLLARLLVAFGGYVPLSGDPGADLARLEAVDPLRDARELATAWERSSAALPMAASSLLAPLTIHAIVWFGLDRPSTLASGMDDFGAWIGLSAIIVGHAHLALLVCAVRWAWRLPRVDTYELQVCRGQGWGKALLVSAGVACLPGVVLLAIPPILVAVTGLAFVPLMYHLTARTIERERTALQAAN